jgi:hypothetical protein
MLVVELPGYIDPQFIDVKFWVQPLSE